MKNFIDANFTSWFAFQYRSKGKWDKLLTGKKARIFATAAGPGWFSKILLFLPWAVGIFWYTGMKNNGIKVFWNMQKYTPEQQKILEAEYQ
jgi:putative NADPH-quinone reductase